MRARILATVLLANFVSGQAFADVPKVVADIGPVHSLVMSVMEGVGTPELLLPVAASPHDFALRPSDARRLQEADVVFWVGPALTPWLERTLETLAGGASRVALLETEGTLLLRFREGVIFEVDAESGGLDEDAHQPHEGDGHDHSEIDPHAWLDPENGKVWLLAIAAELARIDPENAEAYLGNAVSAAKGLDVLMLDLEAELARARGSHFVVLHDGYFYFERRFAHFALGAISPSDAVSPSAARIAEISDALQAHEVACVFTEAQLRSPLARRLAEATNVKLATLDPLGGSYEPAPDFYGKLLKDMAKAFGDCR